jgi:protocatechuate 3,4-dioxygenase beta subunit
MGTDALSRRDLLYRCAVSGALTIAPTISLSAAAAAIDAATSHPSKPTDWQQLGPFYKRNAPSQTQLRMAGDPGLPLAVHGSVFSASGDALPQAQIEIWHADHSGHYDLKGYRFRTRLLTDAAGRYGIDSIMPGRYEDRPFPHIHYIITAPGHKVLTTQIYFATDPIYDGDPQRNFNRNPDLAGPELIRPVLLTVEAGKEISAQVQFEIVLERL